MELTDAIRAQVFELADSIVNADGYSDDAATSEQRAEQRDRLTSAVLRAIETTP